MEFARGDVDQISQGDSVRGHVGENVPDCLEARDRMAELFPLDGVHAGHLDDGVGDSAQLGASQQPQPAPQRWQRIRLQHRNLRPAASEPHGADRAAWVEAVGRLDMHAGCIGGHDRESLARVLGRDDHQRRAPRRVRDSADGAVEHAAGQVHLSAHGTPVPRDRGIDQRESAVRSGDGKGFAGGARGKPRADEGFLGERPGSEVPARRAEECRERRARARDGTDDVEQAKIGVGRPGPSGAACRGVPVLGRGLVERGGQRLVERGGQRVDVLLVQVSHEAIPGGGRRRCYAGSAGYRHRSTPRDRTGSRGPRSSRVPPRRSRPGH